MEKTIWYISKYARPPINGSGTRHFYFSREFNKIGNKTILISSDSMHFGNLPSFNKVYNHMVIDGVDSIIIRTKKYNGTSSVSRIISWIDFEFKLIQMSKKNIPKPDVIIASSLSLLTILSGYLFKKKYNARLIFEVRDIWPLTLIEIGGFSRYNPLVLFLSWVEKFGYKKADVIIGTMPNLKEHVDFVSGSGNKCHNIPQGIELSLLQTNEHVDPDYISKFIPPKKFIIGYAGSIGRANALDTLIQVSILLQDKPDIHFLLIGEGDKKHELVNVVSGNGNVTFAPKVKKTQVQDILRYCDVLYAGARNSLIYRYGISLNKWIDYLFAGKPVIVSYSGYKSMINEADCGTFVPAENTEELKKAILQYSKMSKADLNQMGERGKKWLIENRTYQKLALKYSELF